MGVLPVSWFPLSDTCIDVLVLDSAVNLFKSLLKVFNLSMKFDPCSSIPLSPSLVDF